LHPPISNVIRITRKYESVVRSSSEAHISEDDPCGTINRVGFV